MYPAQEGGLAKETEHCRSMGTREHSLGLRLAMYFIAPQKQLETFSSYSCEGWGQLLTHSEVAELR